MVFWNMLGVRNGVARPCSFFPQRVTTYACDAGGRADSAIRGGVPGLPAGAVQTSDSAQGGEHGVPAECASAEIWAVVRGGR
jgi:hypothetical protein